jgi:hypothetical protein
MVCHNGPSRFSLRFAKSPSRRTSHSTPLTLYRPVARRLAIPYNALKEQPPCRTRLIRVPFIGMDADQRRQIVRRAFLPNDREENDF